MGIADIRMPMCMWAATVAVCGNAWCVAITSEAANVNWTVCHWRLGRGETALPTHTPHGEQGFRHGLSIRSGAVAVRSDHYGRGGRALPGGSRSGRLGVGGRPRERVHLLAGGARRRGTAGSLACRGARLDLGGCGGGATAG